MTVMLDFDDLLEDLRIDLVDTRLEPGQPRFMELAETVGSLCALADRNILSRAISIVQRTLNEIDDAVAAAILTIFRTTLAAAGAAREARKSQFVEITQGGRVRERVLDVVTASNGIRTSDVAARLQITLPQASRALGELSRAGKVERASVDTADQRTRTWVPSRAVQRVAAPFACISDTIRSMDPVHGTYRSDMLPVGPADRAEEAGVANMARQLAASLDKGSYKPVPVKQFRVAKDSDTSRPAALMRLPDRLVYTALTARVCEGLDDTLSAAAFWPRAHTTKPRWTEFERAALTVDSEFVAVADVASFYDTVDHSLLRDSLAERGADPEILQPLQTFLGTVMGGTMGLPQGLPASDTLATFALAPVDDALCAAGYTHFRHGDDFRITTGNRYEAREAIAFLSDQLRQHRLHLSAPKSFPIPTADYRENVHQRESQLLQTFRKAAGFETERGLVGTAEGFDPDADFTLDELGRFEDLDPRIRQLLGAPQSDTGLRLELGRYGEVEDFWIDEPERWVPEPSPELDAAIERAAHGATSAADALRVPGISGWQVKLHRDFFASCLSLLSVVGEPVGDTAWWTGFLQDRPQETRITARYLANLGYRGRSELPIAIAEQIIEGPFTDWQAAWSIAAAACAGQEAVALTRTLSSHLESAGWLTRMASANLLQRFDMLSPTQIHGLWNEAPLALRSDLAVLLSSVEQTSDIARALNVEADELERALAEPALA